MTHRIDKELSPRELAMHWDYRAYEGRRTTEIEVDRPGWRLFPDGCPDGETPSHGLI